VIILNMADGFDPSASQRDCQSACFCEKVAINFEPARGTSLGQAPFADHDIGR
jgi:hypothetical protein